MSETSSCCRVMSDKINLDVFAFNADEELFNFGPSNFNMYVAMMLVLHKKETKNLRISYDSHFILRKNHIYVIAPQSGNDLILTFDKEKTSENILKYILEFVTQEADDSSESELAEERIFKSVMEEFQSHNTNEIFRNLLKSIVDNANENERVKYMAALKSANMIDQVFGERKRVGSRQSNIGSTSNDADFARSIKRESTFEDELPTSSNDSEIPFDSTNSPDTISNDNQQQDDDEIIFVDEVKNGVSVEKRESFSDISDYPTSANVTNILDADGNVVPHENRYLPRHVTDDSREELRQANKQISKLLETISTTDKELSVARKEIYSLKAELSLIKFFFVI